MLGKAAEMMIDFRYMQRGISIKFIILVRNMDIIVVIWLH